MPRNQKKGQASPESLQLDAISPLLNLGREGFEKGRIYGASLSTRDLLRFVIPACAKSGLRVLIYGETGTGKELVARKIDETARRNKEFKGKFVPVNCAAVNPALFESEFFGHVKGAFTGADSDREGYFHAAKDGTLFLDEFGTLEDHAQAKLLRAIDTGTFYRVGESKLQKIKIELLLAATNEPESVRPDIKWRFEEQVPISPLRERISDVFAILYGMLEEEKDAGRVGPGAEWVMTPIGIVRTLYSLWPGNIRELKNAVRRAIARWESTDPQDDLIPFVYSLHEEPVALFRDPEAFVDLWKALLAKVRCARNWRDFFLPSKLDMSIQTLTSVASSWGFLGGSAGSLDPDNVFAEFVQDTRFSLPEVVVLVCLIVDHYWDSGHIHAGIREEDFVYPDDVWYRLLLVNSKRDVFFRLPDHVAARYNDDGSLKPLQEDLVPTLTRFTENDLLHEYYCQLGAQEDWVQKAMAAAAGITPNSISTRLRKYDLKK